MPGPDPREIIEGSFAAAVAAAAARETLAAHLPAAPKAGRVVVVGAGKAAAAMAQAVEEAWPGRELEGLVITRYGHELATRTIRVVQAGHPLPDEAGETAAREILDLAKGLSPEDLLLVLVSGGGSSLMSLPAPGLSMSDLRASNRELLRSGAPISEMNIVRKHLSAISGGRLAAAGPARVLALIISDVTGDDPSAIASGPCAPDRSTFGEAQAIVRRYGLQLPDAVTRHLAAGAAGQIAETPKPEAALFARVENRVIASAHASLAAAAAWCSARGIASVILGDSVTGEACEVARVYAALVREIRSHGAPWQPPVALISGGECTVTLPSPVPGSARGGRCSEFLLALAVELEGVADVWALACDTDGIDGSEDNAGARMTPDSLARGVAAGLDARTLLEGHDAWGFFAALGDLIVTGPTRTNVNDYRIILVN